MRGTLPETHAKISQAEDRTGPGHECRAVSRPTPAAPIPRLFLIMAAVWAFDFQSAGEGEGLTIQATLLAIYLAALALFLFAERASPIRIGWLAPVLGAGALYLAAGIAAGLIEGQSLYTLLRNATNIFVYLSMLYVTAKTLVTTSPAGLRRLLAWLCLVYIVTRPLIVALQRGGIDLSTARFEIVGASVIAALGLVPLLVLFRFSPVQLAAMAANLVAVLLSVTRVYLLVLMVQLLPFAAQLRRLVSTRLLVLTLSGVLALGAAFTFGQGQVLRWEDRLGASGRSGSIELQTYYTRLSEWEFMTREWLASPRSFLLGNGFAAQTQYFLGAEYRARSESMSGFGHNQHISMLFNGGIVGGLPLLALMWLLGWQALRFLRQIARRVELRSDLCFLGAWGAVIVLGTLANDMLAATFGSRANSLWYGIGTGLLLGVLACFDPANARRQHGRGSPGETPQ